MKTETDLLPVPDTIPGWVQVLLRDEMYQRMMDSPDEAIPFVLV